MPMLLEGMCVTIQSVLLQIELVTFMALNKIDKEKNNIVWKKINATFTYPF